MAVVQRCVAFLALSLVAGRASAADPVPDQPLLQKSVCTEACHNDVTNDNPKHAPLKCVDCHANVANGGKDDHAGALDDTPNEKMCASSGCHTATTEKQLVGLHKDAQCDTCHGAVHEKFKRFDRSACNGCHGDQTKLYDDSVHSKAKSPALCGDCHGDLHAVRKSTNPLSPMSKVLQVTTCGECHDTSFVRAYRKSVHGRGLLLSGLAVAPTCSTCHGSHDIAGVKDEAAKVSRKNVVQVCGTCHEFILQRWRNSKHGELWAKGDEKGPVCTTCHSGHYTLDPGADGNHLAMAQKCGECHEKQNESYRDSFHGKATRLGLDVAATCADCHTPHEMLPAKDERSSVNVAHLQKTCQRCHANASASFIQFDPHIDLSSTEKNPAVHYVWVFMTFLLLSVLGLFGVHTLLWLQRSIVGFRRGEFAHPEAGQIWIRRFRPIHIWIHLVIILTFLLLSATGLPLKFSGLEWARPASYLFGGPVATRWLHRIAGVATFGYGIVFASYLLREIVFRKRRELLWGWQSLVPNMKDLADIRANLRWFFYRGPRPQLDRWAYWEKFDFFAVFWGVPVIGLSGLVLWVPELVTRFLPGWALNIAYMIHSDEALLATAFIFFFHFFHTHLRPEAFPLDPVIFTGSMPLERFKEERPAEYAHLLASGDLDKYKVAPPSPRFMRRVYRFGFTALALGVILGICLFVAGFHALLH